MTTLVLTLIIAAVFIKYICTISRVKNAKDELNSKLYSTFRKGRMDESDFNSLINSLEKII